MVKEYTFVFHGTKGELMNAISNNRSDQGYFGTKYFYLDDYMIKFVDGIMHFGVQRGGHSGGYWFIPIVIKRDGETELRGKIRYIGPGDDQVLAARIIDKIWECCLMILLLPLFLVSRLYQLIEWVVRKLRNRPKPKYKPQKTDCMT